MSREPLRLAADEATALLVAARAVATLPGLREGDRQALLRATAKLEAAAGEAAGASSRLSVTFESEGGVFADVDRAIAERRRLWLRYYSPARDELTEREVDPIRLFAVGHTYMEAWCRLSEARRTFRLDRVAEIKLLDAPADPPPVELRDLSEGLVQPAAEDPEVVHRGRARRPLGRRVLPARQRRGTARRRAAHHAAHPRPGLAAPAGAAAGPRRPDRGAAGARGQRAAGRRPGARGVRRVSAADRVARGARRVAQGEGGGSEG